jgi:hypothetical protein
MRTILYIFILLTGVLQLGCEEPRGNDKLSVVTEDERIVNDIGFARLPTPDGWTPNRSGGATSVVFIREDANRAKPEEVISIESGKPIESSVRASADAFAAKFAGSVAELPFDIDGESAFRVVIPQKLDQLFPRQCIVVHHGDKVCFVIGASKSENEIGPVLDGIAKSWKWK